MFMFYFEAHVRGLSCTMMWTTLGYLALLVALITVDYDRVLSHCRKVAFGLYKPRLATDASTCPGMLSYSTRSSSPQP